MTDYGDIAVGKSDFIAAHDLWTSDQVAAAEDLAGRVESLGLDIVRVTFPDQHGIMRGKWLSRKSFLSVLRNGMDFAAAHFCWDTAQAIVYNPFVAGGGFGRDDMSGFPDAVLVPDPTTFRIVPWAPGSGWVLCDMYYSNGDPVPFAPRHVLRQTLDKLSQRGLSLLAGLEVEWYLTKIEDPMLGSDHLGVPGDPPTPPVVSAVSHGYQYQSENHLDEIEPILRIVSNHLVAAGLPLRSIEDEWGPGQLEVTFDPLGGMETADAMMFFRMATKQICRREGYLATFMCQPAIPRFFGSGWHLHQSLLDSETGENRFASASADQPLSDLAMNYIGGLLEHARASCVFSTPTINGYRRVKPFSLAPDRATWGIDNRAAMIRVQGSPGDPGSHLENRVGDPAATPYLYVASQVVAGLDGIERQLDPGEASDQPYFDTERTPLPTSLKDAVAALKDDPLFADNFGSEFVNFIITLKESEIGRYEKFLEDNEITAEQAAEAPTAWEQQEYFELF